MLLLFIFPDDPASCWHPSRHPSDPPLFNQVFLEEDGMSGRYKLIAEKPSRPAGANLVAGLGARPKISNAAWCSCLSQVVDISMPIYLI